MSMWLHAQLQAGHNKDITARIVASINGEQAAFDELMTLMLGGAPRIAQRASWPMGRACEAWPALAAPWLPELLAAVERTQPPGVHRNIWRSLQFCIIPEEHAGRAIDLAFRWIPDSAREIAPRASAITVAARMVREHPDLAQELGALLREVLQRSPTPGIRSRAERCLRVLAKSAPHPPQHGGNLSRSAENA